jgi:hypothetical protein
MDAAPIRPIGMAANLDIAAAMGLTLAQAEQIDCQATDIGDAFGDGNECYAWGDNQEVWLEVVPATQVGDMIAVWPGYVGTLAMTSRDGTHVYSISLDVEITKDGLPYPLDWMNDITNPTLAAEVDELYDALLATYAPGMPADTECTISTACVIGDFGDTGFVRFNPLDFGFEVVSISQAQPAPSTVSNIQLYLP